MSLSAENVPNSTTDQTLENQNEDELNSLHGKIKALRSVSQIVDVGKPSQADLERSGHY
jgi:hypothetical protein